MKCVKPICTVFFCLALYKWGLLPFSSVSKFHKENAEKHNKNNVPLLGWRSVTEVSCANIFSNDSHEIKRARNIQRKDYFAFNLIKYLNVLQNCSKFLHNRRYFTMDLSPEEVNFPIAFSIMVYKDINQFERLLQSIYRVQNFYCVHMDSKMADVEKRGITAIVSCFDNVFISSKSYDVRWSTITSLKADLACMKDLLNQKWKYFINLTGQEFPLKTNLEIVKILKIYNGTNDVKLSSRTNWKHRWKAAIGPAPDGLTTEKGRVHITVNRAFVEFAVKNKTALRLLNWLTPTKHPDETFFTTLNYNPQLGIPGTYNGQDGVRKVADERFGKSMNRYKRWVIQKHLNYRCGGKYVREICIAGVSDLPILGKRPEMFLNKLYWNYHPFVLDCMEELIYNRTVDGFNGKLKFNGTQYSNMYFIKHSYK